MRKNFSSAMNAETIGRITSVHKDFYMVYSDDIGEILCTISGKMRYYSDTKLCVGDFVKLYKNSIIELLPRKTKLSRKVAGLKTEEQIIATNIDYIFIVVSLNDDFNLSKIERYLSISYESGATPIIVLSKADLCPNVELYYSKVMTIAFGTPIHIVTSANSDSITQLKQYFSNKRTVVVIGSSGVGKSTLINKIVGKEIMKTGEIREKDSKGKHTTTHRELLFLEDAFIIDTPGIRELGLWSDSTSNIGGFSDIEELAKNCKYINCTHELEPHCAVKLALESGKLDFRRFQSYKKQLKEIKYLKKRQWIQEIKSKKGGLIK